jgi:hypothetical protein
MSSRVPVQDLLVSVQALDSADDPAAGHLAAGLLVDTDAVVVPSPPVGFLAGLEDFEVLLIPVPLSTQNIVERIRPARVDVFRAPGEQGTAVVALVKLAVPSRYPAVVSGMCGSGFVQALARYGGDWWDALESVGAVSAGVREGPGKDVLSRVPKVERVQRRPLVRELTFPALGDRVLAAGDGGDEDDGICRILPICRRASVEDSVGSVRQSSVAADR